jgi:hypothetical protein
LLSLNTTAPSAAVLTAQSVVLAFVVCGGILFELLKLVPAVWTFVFGTLAKLGIVGKGH